MYGPRHAETLYWLTNWITQSEEEKKKEPQVFGRPLSEVAYKVTLVATIIGVFSCILYFKSREP